MLKSYLQIYTKMTTVAINTPASNRMLPMSVPSYAYHYPSSRNVQLAAVKEGLYHPRLPSFRRMDMDTAAHKLPNEHSRTTTRCGPVDFASATQTLFDPPSKPLSTANITETGRTLRKYYSTPQELTKTNSDWSEFLSRSPEKYNIKLPQLPNGREMSFVGYSVRHMKPQVTGSWRYTLTQEPTLDNNGQRPMPANVYARYRDTYPQYSRNIATEAWR